MLLRQAYLGLSCCLSRQHDTRLKRELIAICFAGGEGYWGQALTRKSVSKQAVQTWQESKDRNSQGSSNSRDGLAKDSASCNNDTKACSGTFG